MKYTLGLLIILVVSPAFAFKNEPNGFRGIKWGTDISVHKKEMTLHEAGSNTRYYLRKNDKGNIGSATISLLAYGYTKGKFTGVIMYTQGFYNQKGIIAAFQSQFGTGQIPYSVYDYVYWIGNKSRISISCDYNSLCSIIMFSSVHYAKDEKKEETKANQSGKDF